jgi:two-component system, OmpR family, sensor histidine kinase ArlS
MYRIEASYKRQSEFTANASHELRTPVARIMAQLENLLSTDLHDSKTKQYLKKIESDAGQMADLIHSLLLLSQVEEAQHFFVETKRLDEIIFNAMETIKKSYPDLQITFSILENSNTDLELELRCNESLLKIAFLNLMRNAYQYSFDHKIQVELEQIDSKSLIIKVKNRGGVLDKLEQEKLFEAFMRGKNAHQKVGSGLGLRITKRILDHHGASILYSIENRDVNVFKVVFKL